MVAAGAAARRAGRGAAGRGEDGGEEQDGEDRLRPASGAHADSVHPIRPAAADPPLLRRFRTPARGIAAAIRRRRPRTRGAARGRSAAVVGDEAGAVRQPRRVGDGAGAVSRGGSRTGWGTGRPSGAGRR
ncbi:hypothetical protein GCM10010123_44520 [Pilimelia anulata]|uniref:Uncharacterized protein n=1 Tax=Pilimelia anulata TaxID=53371 RepID=A0A8J3BHA2_9ACTN|nr:hypothetical protein GCM10010123_44520 [Pilimelia anulata]